MFLGLKGSLKPLVFLGYIGCGVFSVGDYSGEHLKAENHGQESTLMEKLHIILHGDKFSIYFLLYY